MKVQINFKEINPSYDQDYADEYKDGKESDSNMKYNWSVAYAINNVLSVSLIDNESFLLKVKYENNIEFEASIPNVTIFRCHFDNGRQEDFAVSKSILNKTHQAKKEGYDVTRFYFYLNPEPNSIQLGNNLVVDLRDIPQSVRT